MSLSRLALMFVCGMAGANTEACAQFAPPNPDAFVRVEDQQRARLLWKPCAQADEGRGCYRSDGGRLVRESPCSYQIEAGVIGFVATDQCYKMEAPRRYRGIWIDEFEGQQFIPDGTQAPEWPRDDPGSPDWRRKADQAIAARIWLDVERANLAHKWRLGGRRVSIDFIGRKTMYSGNYGHLGMSGQYMVVDRVISQRECPETGPCR